MVHFVQARFVLGVLLLLLPASSFAQGLGGLLNKAKTKLDQVSNQVNKTTTKPVDAALPTTPTGLPANGEDPPTPPEMTPQTQEEYTRLLLSDTRPVVRGSSSYTAAYRQLVQLQHVPIRFSWDQPALVRCVESRIWLNGYISDLSSDLTSSLNGSTYEVYLRPRLAKIKAIHFTPSDQARSLDSPGAEQGWFFSFNAASGVLTAGFNEYASSVSAWSSLSKWIIKNVN